MARDPSTLVWRPGSASRQRSSTGRPQSQGRAQSQYRPGEGRGRPQDRDYNERRSHRYSPRPRGGQYRQGRPQRKRRPLTPEEYAQMKAEGYGRLYINKQIKKKTPMTFELYDGKISAIIIRRFTYDLDLLINGRERKRINKLDVKYCYKRSHESKVLSEISSDEEVKAMNLQPTENKAERFQIDDQVLLQCYRERTPVTLTMIGGETFSGMIDWFSKFEIKIEFPSRKSIVAFRHALHDLKADGQEG